LKVSILLSLMEGTANLGLINSFPLDGGRPGWGCGVFFQFSGNILQHRIQLRQHLIIPVTQHAKILRLEPGIALCIAINFIRMLPAINFNNQTRLQTDKIHYVATKLELPAEFITMHLPQSQTPPKFTLCICHGFAQFPRK